MPFSLANLSPASSTGTSAASAPPQVQIRFRPWVILVCALSTAACVSRLLLPRFPRTPQRDPTLPTLHVTSHLNQHVLCWATPYHTIHTTVKAHVRIALSYWPPTAASAAGPSRFVFVVYNTGLMLEPSSLVWSATCHCYPRRPRHPLSERWQLYFFSPVTHSSPRAYSF